MPRYICQTDRTWKNRRLHRLGDAFTFEDGVIEEKDTNWKLEALVIKERKEAEAKEYAQMSSGVPNEELHSEVKRLTDALIAANNENADLKKGGAKKSPAKKVVAKKAVAETSVDDINIDDLG